MPPKVQYVKLSTPYRLTNEERETIIRFDEAADTARVYTFNPAMIRKLDSWFDTGEPLQLVRAESINGIECREYDLLKSWVRIQKPRQLNLTEEQREVMRQRMREMKMNFSAVSADVRPGAEGRKP